MNECQEQLHCQKQHLMWTQKKQLDGKHACWDEGTPSLGLQEALCLLSLLLTSEVDIHLLRLRLQLRRTCLWLWGAKYTLSAKRTGCPC